MISLPFNWVDWIIFGVLLYFAFRGWFKGFITLTASFLSLFLALFLSVKLETILAPFISEKFGITPSWASVFSYTVIAVIVEVVASTVFSELINYLPRRFREGVVSKVAGAGLSIVNGVILLVFFLLILLVLPIQGTFKHDIRTSFMGPKLLGWIEKNGQSIFTAFEDSARDVSKFLTVQQGSTDRINLDFTLNNSDLSVDQKTERELLILINDERVIRNIPPLLMDPAIQQVARDYSRKMFLEHYFSHVDGGGNDAGVRLTRAQISFVVVGENLAYAPDLKTAHDGLMKSERHRKNILDPQFKRIGIGVIDAGTWGKMFTEEFAN
jgi:uncharacterized protein YkwD/uncharacterized membrane protein required for colicin V production